MPTPLLDAAPARAHLAQLAALGVGYRRAAQLARVSVALVRRIRAGLQRRIRATSAARILAIPASLAHGAVIRGVKTWRYVDSLRREGFTHRALAQRLGARSQQLQLHRHVRVRSALKMAQLYHQLADA